MADPWINEQGITRLTYLKFNAPDPTSASVVHDYAHSVARHREQLNTYLSHTIDPEPTEDRQLLWKQYVSCVQNLPDWMTVMAPGDRKNWPTVLIKYMQCDAQTLPSMYGPCQERQARLGRHMQGPGTSHQC